MMEQVSASGGMCVNTIPFINTGESASDYFRRLFRSYRIVKQSIMLHNKWKMHHMNGIGILDCLHRIQVVLGEILKSNFLRQDWFDTGLPKNYREHAVRELCEKGFDELLQYKDADWKFAILSQLRAPGESRIVIREHNAGYYISEMHDKLSAADVELFFRNMTFIRLAYKEIDRLEKDKTDHEFTECLMLMERDLEPLREFISDKYYCCFDSLMEEIFRVGRLRETIKLNSPTTFNGGYNQKLACNLVGLLCSMGVYRLNQHKADQIIYPGKTHYTYINSFAGPDTSSELDQNEVKTIRKLIIKYAPD